MERNLELRNLVEQVEDTETLKSVMSMLLDKMDDLEGRLENLKSSPEKGVSEEVIAEKRERLDRIRHGITELTERMNRPYVVSDELAAIKEVLDTLAESGDCNSIILEGEPGTGKTQWAYSEAGQEIQDGKNTVLVHVRVKDTMRAQDLLYSIDDVRRLSDAQAHAQIPETVRAEAVEWKQKILKGEINPTQDEQYKSFKAKMEAVTELGEAAKDLDYLNYADLGPLGEAIQQSNKEDVDTVILLIDEIEKGREELMTGMLDEIENLQFTIGETGTVIKGNKKKLRIIITTNPEDADKIPSSFRRRSLYHYIDYPSRSDMAQIVELNFPGLQKELMNYAISVFYQYQNNPDIQKKPSTPELLAWIRVLSKEYQGTIPDGVPYKEILLKYRADQDLDIGKINVEVAEAVEASKKDELPHHIHKAFQGNRIYHINDELNAQHAHDEGRFGDFYAQLENRGVHYVTPKFEEVEEEDRWGNDRTVIKNTRNFQAIMPGLEYLGENYYVIPEDKINLFQPVLDKWVEIIPPEQDDKLKASIEETALGNKYSTMGSDVSKSAYPFVSINEKNSKFTKGRVKLADGETYDAYLLSETGQLAVIKNYNLGER